MMADRSLSEKQDGFLEVVRAAFNKEIIKKLVFSRPKSTEIKKVSARLCRGKRGSLLALEYSLPGDTVSHKNIGKEELDSSLSELLADYAQANLITTLGEAEWKISSFPIFL